ncbi:hypothetical protein [Mycoplasma sp. Ms02]|uniref:hypothetical protein n=1 Tax=Mycoplasma sp. Ms02 TaxID=353851 RepID=UPI001C8A83D6|nr:hypothetical protein [Mycoplasma sp. Ms02]QZE12248.1 hypothetical protein K4L35_02855 [Mycoplasma sp. Ms02]
MMNWDDKDAKIITLEGLASLYLSTNKEIKAKETYLKKVLPDYESVVPDQIAVRVDTDPDAIFQFSEVIKLKDDEHKLWTLEHKHKRIMQQLHEQSFLSEYTFESDDLNHLYKYFETSSVPKQENEKESAVVKNIKKIEL